MENLNQKQLDELKERINHWNTMPDLDIKKLGASDFNSLYFIVTYFFETGDFQAAIDRLITMVLYLQKFK